MKIEVHKYGRPLGHEILGVDLSTGIDETDLNQIKAVFHECGVVVLRGQHLTPDEQVSFSKRLGDLTHYMINDYLLPGYPEIFVVSNIIENGKPIGLEDAGSTWHSDMCFSENPPYGSLLYALEVPTKNGKVYGDTLFGSTQAAYDALPQSMKHRLEGLKVVNSYGRYIAGKKVAKVQTTGEKSAVLRFDMPPDIAQPLVRRHPITGRCCLYLSQGLSHEIEGLPETESKALIAELLEHMTRPEFTYRHSWRVGDLVLWDNCSAIHRATVDYALPLRRLMYRTTLAGLGRPQ
ncbi:TauD/TfdA dioxygenase family protein [Candidimonas nitroreducens]|uniref:Taurine dioxygenase n=1 Tax=Candidimonas nitroreducens TaxID=683354 RepID=A0A225M7L4_9BURK|nr:TauD/TfdA family dioxygenase [Candidimonas nitroreducens]OWT56233.1 taurine dioxygenase [Candidimonas nitroreducens]